MMTSHRDLSDLHSGQPKALWAYDAIRHAIISMQLAPGAVLNEKEICQDLGISRTPMREAVLRLAQEGLIQIVPSGGTFVSKVDIRKILEGHLVRASIELQTVRIAARHYDNSFDKDLDLLIFRQQNAMDHRDSDEAFLVDGEFHRTICKIAGFPNVWKTIHASTGQLDRARRLAFPNIGFFEEVVAEHRAIYQAIKERQESQATALMHEHLGSIKEIVAHILKAQPDALTNASDAILLDDIAAI
jgi:DNA-binding GntR family transcriptional regulator